MWRSVSGKGKSVSEFRKNYARAPPGFEEVSDDVQAEPEELTPAAAEEPTATTDGTEEFITENCVEEKVAAKLRNSPADVRLAVIARGSLSGTRNPAAALLARIRSASAQAQCLDSDSAETSIAFPGPISKVGGKGKLGGKFIGPAAWDSWEGKGKRGGGWDLGWDASGKGSWDCTWKGKWVIAGTGGWDRGMKGWDASGKAGWGAGWDSAGRSDGTIIKGGQVITPGVYYEGPGVGIAGLKQAVERNITPLAHLEDKWPVEEMVNKVCMGIFKTASKWYKEDHRGKEQGTVVQAQALVEEFVEKVMGSLSTACYDRPWFVVANLAEPIAVAAVDTFKGCKLFHRTVAPIILTYTEETVFRCREEERISLVMWGAAEVVGLPKDYQKRTNKHLQTSYEHAHVSAQAGGSFAETPELGAVQDFVVAWMRDFAKRAYDIIQLGAPPDDVDGQIRFMTTLFHHLTDPAHSCIPHELTQALENLPPAHWPFINEVAIVIYVNPNAA